MEFVLDGPVQENSSVFKVSATDEARVVPLDSLVAVLDCQESHLTMFTSIIIVLHVYFQARSWSVNETTGTSVQIHIQLFSHCFDVS